MNENKTELLHPSSVIPHSSLLVSVRNAAEALSALRGGCGILDIKEPTRGSLGFANPDEMETIIRAACGFATCPISAALGEAHEWHNNAPLVRLPTGLSFLKIGTAGLGNSACWVDDWQQAHHRIQSLARESGSHGVNTIIVANADWRLADSPSPEDVLEAASQIPCDGILIDTHVKNGRGLFDWMTVSQLQQFVERVREMNLVLALAGSLKLSDVPRLLEVDPDIIGIRSAACVDGVRDGEIDERAVRQFRDALVSYAKVAM